MQVYYYLKNYSQLPPFYYVAEFLWTPQDTDSVGFLYIDSDGNSNYPDDLNWTELMLENRGCEPDSQRIDVFSVEEHPGILKIDGSTSEWALKAAYYLARYTGGWISESLDGPGHDYRYYEDKLGNFNIEMAWERAARLLLQKPKTSFYR